MTLRPLCLTLAALLTSAPAFADLKDERRISEGLITVGIAYEISEVCPDISARKIRGLRYLLALKSAASGLGYSSDEIDAYIDDDVEKDRLEVIARQRLAALGARKGDVAAHCAVGRAQVAQDTQVGRLLNPR